MKLRFRTSKPVKIGIPLAPYIDVSLLLLIFFMLNLKIVAREGEFQFNLPFGSPTIVSSDQIVPDLKVGLRSDREGNLTQITLNSRNLGHDDAAFERLNKEILRIIGRPGGPLTKEIEVEIDADFETQHQHVVRTIAKCSGHFDPGTKQLARYVEKIKFTSPHQPK